jgi:hypothetical protein
MPTEVVTVVASSDVSTISAGAAEPAALRSAMTVSGSS